MKNKLKKHLIRCGFRFFDKYDQYDQWRENYFNESGINVKIKKKYKIFLKNNLINKRYSLSTDFYDLIAKDKKLMLITHSMKSSDILNSGTSVINELRGNSNILDIGCNSAYLTSFYAKIFPNSYFIGLDNSKNSILQASNISNLKQYPNLALSYDYDILYKYKFNFIIDTQCFCTLKQKELLDVLDLLKNCMDSNTRIVSISNLRNEKETNIFLKLFREKNIFVESISPLLSKSLNGIVAFTKIIFTKKKNDNNYDVKYYFKDIEKKISIVNLCNLN